MTAENLSGKTITATTFSLCIFDKSKVRIGGGYCDLTNVAPGQTIKFQVTTTASGTPSSLAVAVTTATPHSVSITVNSVPQGADFSVDGKAAGATPKVIEVASGKHLLEFQKEGFNPGTFPLEITAQDASGGSVSHELGTSAHDTIELRDGSILVGELISISGMQIEVRVEETCRRSIASW